MYGKYKYLLKSEVTRLLNDDLEDVLEGILPNLAVILVDLAQCGAFQKEQKVCLLRIVYALISITLRICI